MHIRFIVLFGVFLGSCVPTVAQTLAPQIVERVEPTMTMLRTVSAPLPAASFLLYQDPGNSPAPVSPLFAGAHESDHTIERLLPMEEVKILFFTKSSMLLVQLWGGRLQLDAFQSTLHTQNVPLDPLSYRGTQGFRSARHSYPGGPSSVHLSGFSVSYHFGHDARTGRQTEAWRNLSRIVGTLLN
jgi:hypothetical protein